MNIDPQIKQELKRFLQVRIARKSQKVIITSSYDLTKSDKSFILANIPFLFRKTDFEYRLDRKLLGGIIIKIGSKLIDLSLKGKIANLKQKIYENS